MPIIFDTIKIPNLHRYIPEFNTNGTEKHIVLEGARFHVKSFTSKGIRCSCANCELNKPEMRIK